MMKAHNECGADRPATAAMCFCHSAQERPPPKENAAGRRIEMNVRPIWSGKKKKGNPQQNHIYIWAQTAQGNTPTAAAAPAC